MMATMDSVLDWPRNSLKMDPWKYGWKCYKDVLIALILYMSSETGIYKEFGYTFINILRSIVRKNIVIDYLFHNHTTEK